MSIEEINKEAEKFHTLNERIAFSKGARMGWSLAVNKFYKQFHQMETLRTNNTIVVNDSDKIIKLKYEQN